MESRGCLQSYNIAFVSHCGLSCSATVQGTVYARNIWIGIAE